MEMVSALEVCLEVTKEIDACMDRKNALRKQIQAIEAKIAKISMNKSENKKANLILAILTLLYVAMSFIMVIYDLHTNALDLPIKVPIFNTYVRNKYIRLIFRFIVNFFNRTSFFLICIIVCIVIRFLLNAYNKKVKQKALQDKIHLEHDLKEINVQLQERLHTPAYAMCQKLIPPDYRKANIIMQFIFFFRNGHVSTIKEAVILYDTYRHREIMEQYTREIAINSCMIIKKAERMQKTLAQIEAITAYNTFLNMDNNS